MLPKYDQFTRQFKIKLELIHLFIFLLNIFGGKNGAQRKLC